jgi:hypothetical protein
LQGGRRTGRDWGFLIVVLLILAALVVIPILVLIWVIGALV